MSLSLKIEKEFSQSSERVKSVDIHPNSPMILASLYSGTVCIWNYQSQTIEKSIKVTESPVRSAKFIARKNWIVTAADDSFIRVYNYDTTEKIIEFEAHKDYIRSLAVHPTLPYLLSASDDKTIKLWDWENGWTCTRIFEGHSHYVMQVALDPKDTHNFASASLDGTVMSLSAGDGASFPTIAMGDAAQTTSSSRFVPVNFSHPVASKLDNNNFLVWRRQVLATVRGHRLQDFLSDSTQTPPRFLSPADELLRVVNSSYEEWEQQDQLLVSWMLASMSDSILSRMVNCETAAQIWRTVEIWNIGSSSPSFTLEPHSKGVNCVDYFSAEDKPYLLSGSDDFTAKVWDYQTKGCVQTLEGHLHNVTAVCVHPELPIAITGSEDGTVRIWHATTYSLENTLNYDLGRVWTIGYIKGSQQVVFGCDNGIVVVKINVSDS